MNLTPSEAISILELAQHPGVSYADISYHKSGNIHIDVCSEENATWSDIDSAINEIFPDSVYVGDPSVRHRCDGTVADLYMIDAGAVKINLHMIRGTKKTSTAMEATKETIQSQCIIDASKVESLMDRRMPEDVLRGKTNE